MSDDQPEQVDPYLLTLDERSEYRAYDALIETAKRNPFKRLGHFLGVVQPPSPEWDKDQIGRFREKYSAFVGEDFERSMELYNAYREKVTHEDALVNFRTSWFMGVQTILFPTYVFSIRFTEPGPENNLPAMIALVGIVVAVTSLISVLAARRAVNKTAEKWTHPYIDNDNQRFVELGIRDIVDPHGLLPSVKGAGSSQAIAIVGNISSLFLPLIVCVFWGFLIVNGAPEPAKDRKPEATLERSETVPEASGSE